MEYACNCEDHIVNIASGRKIWEGRRYTGKWKHMNIDDTLIFTGSSFIVTTRVTAIERFSDFDQAFKYLGETLLPDHVGTGWDYYKQYYDENSDVVVIGVETLNILFNWSNGL